MFSPGHVNFTVLQSLYFRKAEFTSELILCACPIKIQGINSKVKCVHALSLMESIFSKLNMGTAAVVFQFTLEFSCCLDVTWWQFKILPLVN